MDNKQQQQPASKKQPTAGKNFNPGADGNEKKVTSTVWPKDKEPLKKQSTQEATAPNRLDREDDEVLELDHPTKI